MKIAILHDFFDKHGGGEKLILTLAKDLNADIYTAYVDPDKTHSEIMSFNVVEIAKKIKLGGLKTIYLMKKFEALELDGYDFYIFSGTNCITASKKHHPNLIYVHTPPRYLYDLKEWFDSNTGFLGRIGLRFLRWYVYPKDQYYMRQFDKILTNSENVRQRILKYYDRELYNKSEVVYTAIDTKKFYYKKPEFYLSTSRLDPLKRIDLVIRAFKEINEKLFIVGTGPEESKLKKLAKGCDNIKFIGTVNEKELLDLYSRCKATIVAAIDEDLGLASIESQAAGKPVIAVREGGLMETVNTKTGIFFEPNVDSLKKAIDRFEKIKWNKKEIQKKVIRFDRNIFIKKMKKIIDEIIDKEEKGGIK